MSDQDYDHEPPSRIPRWAKLLGIILSVLVVILVAMILVGVGGHGPQRH